MITGVLIGDGLSRKNQWQVTRFKGKPLLKYPLDAMLESGLDQVILVVGKDYHLIFNKIKIPSDKLRFVMNRKYERGLSSYVKSAMSLISPECDAVLVAMGEYPLLTASLLDRMLEYFTSHKNGILVPQYEKEIGKPYIFDKKYFNNLRLISGNDIGQSVIKKFKDDVHRLEVKNPGVIKGIDRIQELETVDSREIDRTEREAAENDKFDVEGVQLTDIKSEELSIAGSGDSGESDNTAAKEPTREEKDDKHSAPKTKVFLDAPEQKHISGLRQFRKPADEISLKRLNDLLGTGGSGASKKPVKKKIKQDESVCDDAKDMVNIEHSHIEAEDSKEKRAKQLSMNLPREKTEGGHK